MQLNFPEIEKKILKFWQENRIFEKLCKKNQGKERWSFLDGPITANNPMGVHHAWGRTYKDLFQRFKAMQGYDQRYQNGFDCQGLWVEVEVEKELGFKTKKDIEKYGIDKFVEKCKERVRKFSEIQTAQSVRLGQWMDWKNSYYTMSDENNYAIWHFLKKCWEKGFLYKGRDVVPWCPRCGTAISQHEILTEEYQEIIHKSIFVKLPISGRKNAYFLVWTTTPWTLPANVALAVSPKLEYAEIQDQNKDTFILLSKKTDLISGSRIVKKFLGKQLEGLEYQGMFDELEGVKKDMGNQRHKVVLWQDVSEEEGTGVVHVAPGCGQEDFQLSKELEIPAIDPTDDESRYKEGFGELTGKFVVDVADLVFENLTKKDLVYKIENYKHRYPTCWRCKKELIFRLVDEWYISMQKLRKPLMEVAKKIKWIPDFGLERELDWLKNMQDWLISKKRYWGLALPIYECDCGKFEVIGSKEELKKRAADGWEEFEGQSPHRPWVDKVKIKCSKCGKIISRIPDVGNPWLDAGIVPFSTVKYFEDKGYWKKWFPIELVCESFPGQFKNWFYSIIVMSTVLENTSPVKTIFGYASVRDEKGEEMHKSKGNAIWFDEAVEKIGADPMRWMYARQNPAYNLNFGYKAAEEIKRKILILYNILTFFSTYVKSNEIPEKMTLKSKNILDKWIVSKLNNLINKASKELNNCNPAAAVLAIEEFFIDDLSLWYVRRSRRRFQQEHQERKQAIETLYHVILNLLKIIAPIMPFFSEEAYQQLKGTSESVHLCDWPKTNKREIDKELEEKMAKVREIVNQVLAERIALGIKVRQPLSELKIKNKELSEELLETLKEEVNVRSIVFDKNLTKEIKLNTKITEDLKLEGIRREGIRTTKELRKIGGYSPDIYITDLQSTATVFSTEDFLKEVGAKKAVIISGEDEIPKDYIKKEVKIQKDKKDFIAIPKIKK